MTMSLHQRYIEQMEALAAALSQPSVDPAHLPAGADRSAANRPGAEVIQPLIDPLVVTSSQLTASLASELGPTPTGQAAAKELLTKALAEAELAALLTEQLLAEPSAPEMHDARDRSFRSAINDVLRRLSGAQPITPPPPPPDDLAMGREDLTDSLSDTINLVTDRTSKALDITVGGTLTNELKYVLEQALAAVPPADPSLLDYVRMAVFQLLVLVRDALVALFGEQFQAAMDWVLGRVRAAATDGLVDILYAPAELRRWGTDLVDAPCELPECITALHGLHALRQHYDGRMSLLVLLAHVASKIGQALGSNQPDSPLIPIIKGVSGLIAIYGVLLGADALDAPDLSRPAYIWLMHTLDDLTRLPLVGDSTCACAGVRALPGQTSAV